MCKMAAILAMFHQTDFCYFRFGGCQEISRDTDTVRLDTIGVVPCLKF